MNLLRKNITGVSISFCFAFIVIACSSDDSVKQATTTDLLTSGKWYLESIFQKTLTPCEKKGYFEFNGDGSFFLSNYSTDNEVCEVQELLTGSYTLTNDETILVVTPDETYELFIVAIYEEEMIIISDEIYTLDKVEG